MKRIVPNSLKEHKESKVLETKADKIIFTAAVAVLLGLPGVVCVTALAMI